MNIQPILGAFFGDWPFIVMLVTVVMICVVVVPVAGIVTIVYFIAHRGKSKPQPEPTLPAPPVARAAAPLAAQPAPAAVSPLAPKVVPVPAKTVPMAHECPECGTPLAADAPEGLCPACLLKHGFATEAGPAAGAAPFVPPPIEELAKLFPQLEILECLGRGGMGAVYKARQPRLDRFVALKILAPERQNDPQFAERFEREARVLARLNHPNIVAVFDFGEVQGRYYLIMEYVDGLTLRQVLHNRKLTPAEALQLVPKICEALQYAHEQGIVHRDIKPENILMDKQGHVKIADFGIAKITGVSAQGLSLTGASDIMGTPVYMAPEQVEKPQTVDHRADIYSLGVVFYEMLTGELPLGKFAPPSKKVQVDVRLDEVVLHSLEKEPSRRYQQASQVKTAVETIAGTPPPLTPGAVPLAGPAPAANSALITAPAVALMIAGLWKMLSAFLIPITTSWMERMLGQSFFAELGAVMIGAAILFKVVPGLLICFGGYQMLKRRSYAWSLAAGILSIVACSLVSLPIGIWTLVVLMRDDVKSAFGMGPGGPTAPGQPDHFWRHFALVVAGLVLIPLALLIVGAAVAVFTVPALFPKASAKVVELPPAVLQTNGIRQVDGEFQKDSTQTLPLDARGRFSIDNINGRVDIHGWNSNVVMLTANIHGRSSAAVNAVKIKVDAGAEYVAVHTDMADRSGTPWSWSFGDMWGEQAVVDYVIQAPAQAELREITSVNGHINIDGMKGDITASTVNGHADIAHALHNLKLSTVNGHIRADMDVLREGQRVALDTVNGHVELTVPEDADAAFSVTSVNGHISSDFPSLQAVHEFPVGNNLNGRLGKGNASVKGNTVNGTVRFSKGPASGISPKPQTAATEK